MFRVCCVQAYNLGVCSVPVFVQKSILFIFPLFLIFFNVQQTAFAQATAQSYTTPGEHNFTAPAGVTQITVEAWGGGGAGGKGGRAGNSQNRSTGGGGGGGAYQINTNITVIPGSTYTITVGKGGGGLVVNGDLSGATFGVITVTANGGSGGANGSGNTDGIGGAGGSNGTYNGGTGADGGGGGGSAGTSTDGNNGVGVNGGSAVVNGGAGGNANTNIDGSGFPGLLPGGGGGGGFGMGGNGGAGANGKVIITYCTSPTITSHPSAQNITYGVNASFSTATSASNVSSYQWQVNTGISWVNISGANSSTLNLALPTVAMSGNQYRCNITNSCGSYSTSNAAALTVNRKTLTVTAGNQTIAYGTINNVLTTNGTNTITGFVNGENSSVINGLNTISYSSNYTETTNAGSIGISITPNIAGLSASNYNFAVVSGNVTITKADQVVSFSNFQFTLPLNSFDTVPIVATSNSGLQVTVTLESGSAATLNYDSGYDPPYYLTNIGEIGFVTIHATQPGNANFNAAATESQTFDVTKSNQIISFPDIDDLTYNNNLSLNLQATASSGLSVSYSLISGSATVSGNILTITGSGGVSVRAYQGGNPSYNAASDVTQSFSVGKGTQTITINVPAGALTESTQITASSTSGLPVTLILGSGSNATSLVYNSGGGYYTLTGIGASGNIYLIGNQSGNADFLSANQVMQTIDLSKSNQTITFNSITNQIYSPTLTVNLAASASSGLSVSYSVLSGPATLLGNVLTITGAGTIMVTASQSGNAIYNPAPTVTQQFEVEKATPVIIQNDITKAIGDAAFSIIPSSASSGVYSFNSGDNNIFTISGSIATITGGGISILDITQQPSANYYGAVKTVSFTVNKAISTITMTGATSYIYTGLNLGPETSIVSGSSGSVTYSYVGTGTTVYDPSSTRPANAGNYAATAKVAEDNDYYGATSVPLSFTISKGDAIVSVTPFVVTYDGTSNISIGAANGLSGESLSGLDLTGTVHTDAGTYNDTWAFTDVTGNYNNASGTVENIINTKNLTITASNQVKCAEETFTFTGTEFTSSATVDGEIVETVTLTSTGSSAGAGAGNYDIIPLNATGDNFNPDNYSISYINGQMTVRPLPTLSGASQVATVCDGSNATISLSGLLPQKIFSLDYSINGIPQVSKTGLFSDSSGNSSFTVALSFVNDNQILQITGITLTGETPSCTGSFTWDVILSVDPLPTLTSATQASKVCDGSVATINLIGMLPNTTFTLYYLINDIDQTPITGLTSDGTGASSFTTPSLITANNGQILQIYSIVNTGETPECGESFTQDVTLSVNPISVGGTANADQTICSGNSPSDITLTGEIGAIQWQVSTDNVTFSDISGATSSPLTSAQMGTLTTTKYYRAKVTSGVCAPEYSAAVTVTVNSLPSPPTATNAQICIGSTATLSASGAISGQVYKWYNVESAGTLLKTSTSNTDNKYTTQVLGVTTNFWVAIQSAAGCESTRTKVTATFPAVSPDSQTTSGNDSWIGHVYDGTTLNSTAYYGYYTENQTFSQGFGGNTACFSLSSSLGSRSIYTETYSVRYRMTTSLSGCYLVNLRADDGIRLFVNGTKIFDRWINQAPTDYINVLLPLTTNSQLVYEYYENGGQNEVAFRNLYKIENNVLTGGTNQAICAGNPASQISATANLTANSVALPAGITTSWQWYYSNSPTNTGTIISGATNQNYTPSGSPFNSPGTYYVYRVATVSSSNGNNWGATSSVSCQLESDRATITVNPLPNATVSTPNSSICAEEDTVFTLSGTSSATVTYNINGGTNTTVVLTGGNATVTITGATTNQTINLVSVTDGTCSQTLAGNATVTVNPLPATGEIIPD